MANRSRVMVRAPRRRKGWDAGPGQLAVQSNVTAIGSVLFSAGTVALQDGLTLLRLRGMLTFILNSVSAAPSGFTGAFGIGIVKNPAFTIGVTAV